MRKIRWGVLGAAKIAREWVIPAIQESRYAEIVAVASRDPDKAKQCAEALNIPEYCGSYEELLSRDDIDAIYNPLPNHLHVPLSVKAANAGKHVLCEKPLGLDIDDIQPLIDLAASKPDLVIMEAFMYRFHPQWTAVRELISAGELGKVTQVQASFTYFNRDPENVRNMPGIGGGGLMDIGCYCISAARLAFQREPERALGILAIDRDFQVDCHASGVLDFGVGTATINCSTQSSASQLVQIIGEKGCLIIDTPFYARPGAPCELTLFRDNKKSIVPFGYHNHYVNQIDAFCRAVQDGGLAPTPLADAAANMKVIGAMFKSNIKGSWVDM